MPEFLSDNTTTTPTTISDDPPEADVLVRLGPQMQFVFSDPQRSFINHIFMYISQPPWGHPIGLMIPGMTSLSATVIATALLVAFDTGKTVYCYIACPGIGSNSLILTYLTAALSLRTGHSENDWMCIKDKNNNDAYLAIKPIDSVGEHVGLGYTDRVYIVDHSMIRVEHRPHLIALAQEGHVFTVA